jgi:ribosomal protein L37E
MAVREVAGTIACKECGRYTFMADFRRAVKDGRIPAWALELLETVGICRRCGSEDHL